MPRLFIVFRTFDRIWSCKTYTKEVSPFEFDKSSGDVKLVFSVDPISFKDSHFQCFYKYAEGYCNPHRHFKPHVLQKEKVYESVCCSSSFSNNIRRYSLPIAESDLTNKYSSDIKRDKNVFYVLPKFKCTILLDAHMSSAISQELVRSRAFRKRFLRYVKSHSGFRDCLSDYEKWTEEEKQMWDNYLSVPFMIDIVAVWPEQKIDFPWQYKILSILNMHISLEEGFAWLSTLGGAHSALGELFLEHAEKAGNISKQQLNVAKLLGNRPMMARCYIFWSWSLMQKWELRKAKKCIRNIWIVCKTLRPKDHILENMCRAVWSRLQYRHSISYKQKHGDCSINSGYNIQFEHSRNSKLVNVCDTTTSKILLSSGDGKIVNGLRKSSPVTVPVF